ncbi:MAG TPA: HEAT repeat domain-containing protein, partial [Anaerolineales bacterium]|nr:HEAT repeat domain-containing protein [Anaerolineales bacterium]
GMPARRLHRRAGIPVLFIASEYNEAMDNPEAPSFSDLLTDLLDPDSTILEERIFGLSNLGPADLDQLADTWSRIPLERRRRLVAGMEALAATDPLLFFEEVGKIAIHDEDPEVRVFAIRLTSLEEDPAFAAALIALVEHDPHFEVRAGAAFALGKYVYLGEIEEIPYGTQQKVEATLLAAHRGDEQDLVRRRALEAISFSSRDEVNSLIEDAYARDDEDWQQCAVYAMGASANPRWSRQVTDALASDSPALRYEAARAAGKLDIADLKDELFELAQNDDDEEVRQAALWALSDIGGEGVVEFIQDRLENTEDPEEIELLEEALDNLAASEFFDDLDLPLFDFDEEDLVNFDGMDDEGDDEAV